MTDNIYKDIVAAMITIQELRELLNQHLEKKQESKNAFAKRLGIQQASIFRFIKGDSTLALEPALKVLEDMGYKLLSPEEAKNLQFSPTELPDKANDELAKVNSELKDALKKIVNLQDELLKNSQRKPSEVQAFKGEGGVFPTVDAN